MQQPKLSETEIDEHLSKIPDWKYEDGALNRTYKFANFVGSIQFVNQIALDAEAMQHHPDIDIRYDSVALTLTTHDSGGVTMHDVQLAAVADDVADQTSK